MKTLYLDHNILVNEGNWDSLRRVVADGTVRLAVSSWNIVEIEQGEDSDQMLRRAEFIAAPTYLSMTCLHCNATR